MKFNKKNIGNAAQVLRMSLSLPYVICNRIVKEAIVFANMQKDEYETFGKALADYLASPSYQPKAIADGIYFEVKNPSGEIVFWSEWAGMKFENVVMMKVERLQHCFLNEQRKASANSGI